ncbi:unnamed protein product [Alopecurus aequalis]
MSRPQARSYRRKPAASSGRAHHGHGGGGHGRPARWPARIMDGFRKILVGLVSFPPRPPKVTFSVDERSGRGRGGVGDAVPNRASCSANLDPVNAHYDEAIADCVEFFNRSARVDVRSS